MTSHEIYTLSDTSATNITPGRDSGFDITIQNINSSGYIYIGGPEVSTTNYGFRIAADQAFSVELDGSNDLYLVSSDNEMKAAVLRLNLERNPR
jgi:hypothetical protein